MTAERPLSVQLLLVLGWKKWGKCSYFWHLVAKNSCHMLDSYYMIEVFNTYNRGVDYNNPYFSIERCEENKKEDEYFLSSSFWFLKGGIGNRSWCSGFEKEKNCASVFDETIIFI